ncbi:2,3-bisphosphoglycerate-independent phosphoglycerate mutase [Helicobacter ailurogastricus]|uniref:2,3-bisphosphoglycerate-independent phosphoglycerate mutase n=1 Tax=Helicobacter ailurogastricus TaxID=1578720 RepID=UPI0022C1BCC1|nr:2,3-bisphosphoglycerate-independent phosphoglycerate mutase [Helicobacter ailurogastricus]GLH57824.1 2,3-bisphosphoglycerate-independent phosphoglycerate mutase Pgm [Helicobacter ailurogastricus]GLH58966.1 2,3-bisphosphoglycerate-independent phosphoglycerate mutase Pgm [Helicobacter ailurogastricus]
MQKTLLIITDGIGHNPNPEGNAFLAAKKPTYDWLFGHVPHSLLKTHGLSVGLPEEQMGNSEVGHMCIGAGRTLYQDLVRISKAFAKSALEDNPALKSVTDHAKVVHVIGLMSDGGVHAHIQHFTSMALLLERLGKKVWLHLITDGRDVLPQSALEYLEIINSICSENIHIASLAGRFFAMDRDKRYERLLKAYNCMVHAENKTDFTPERYIKEMYYQGVSDEFIEPVSFAHYPGMFDGEGVVCINFRSDRMRQLAQALGGCGDLEGFKPPPELYIATMTSYSPDFAYPVLFEKPNITHTLAQVVSEAGLSQAHIAETEKYAHVSFFINGGVEEPFKNEERVLIESPKVKTYDLCPEMSAFGVADAVCAHMQAGKDLIIVNFANGDMVGHTGNFKAAILAVEAVDKALGQIVQLAKELDYALVLTSDHGNCEHMQEGGQTLTNHTTYEVYCFIMGDGVKRLKNGGLNNVAASVLKLMGLEIPSTMDAPLF